MKTSLAFIAGIWLLVIGPMALGATTVTLTDTDGDGNPNAVSVAPGSSIDVNITVTTGDMVMSVSFQADLTAGTSNVFDVTALSYGTGWDPPGSDIGLPFTYTPPFGLDPSLTIGSARSELDPVTGSFIFGTVTLKVDAAAAAGLYTLNLTSMEVADENFEPLDSSAGPNYQITVLSTAPPGGGGSGGGGGGVTPPPNDTPPPPPPDTGGTEPPPDGTPTDTGGTVTPPDGTPTDTGGSTGTGGTQDGSGNTVTPPPPKNPRPICGFGAPQAATVCLTGLFWLHGRSRRKR